MSDTARARSETEITWIGQREDLAPLQGEWQALADRRQADIYLMPEWFDLWWEHFGEGRQLACLVARRNGALVGLVPFCIDKIRIGPLALRIARLAGTDPHCIVFHLPVEADMEAEVMAVCLDHLFGHLHCDMISFTPVSDLSDLIRLVRSACSGRTALMVVDQSLGSHVVFDLPESFDQYLSGLSKKRRGQFRRDLKGLRGIYGMETSMVFPHAEEFNEFMLLHTRQWQALGRNGHFNDWPGSAIFYSSLAEQTAETGHVQLHKLTGRTGPLTMQFALVSGKTCFWRLPARTLDAEAERLSIGKVGLVLMIEQLISDGIRRIEAGRGEYDYKLVYGGTDIPVHRLVVSRATWLARTRLRLLLAWADLLDLLYYRIWFLKLAPRLRRLTGAKPRPLWRVWIRTRL